jgi:hypothetical protein
MYLQTNGKWFDRLYLKAIVKCNSLKCRVAVLLVIIERYPIFRIIGAAAGAVPNLPASPNGTNPCITAMRK